MSPSARRIRPSPRWFENLQDSGAMDYTVVVCATSADPAPLQYYRPLCWLRRWLNTSCTSWVRTRCASTTTCPSRQPPTASCRCSCDGRPAAKPIPATFSTPTPGFSNAPPSSPRSGSSFPRPWTKRKKRSRTTGASTTRRTRSARSASRATFTWDPPTRSMPRNTTWRNGPTTSSPRCGTRAAR